MSLFNLTFDPPLDDLFNHVAAHVDVLPSVLSDVGSAYFGSSLPPFVDDLKTKPGAVVYPIAWESEAQRLASRYTNNWGWGIPYQRDNKGTSQQWSGLLTPESDALTVTVMNSDPDAVYLFGSFQTSDGSPQQKYHQRTGWRVIKPLVQSYFNDSANAVAYGLNGQAGVFMTWWSRL